MAFGFLPIMIKPWTQNGIDQSTFTQQAVVGEGESHLAHAQVAAYGVLTQLRALVAQRYLADVALVNVCTTTTTKTTTTLVADGLSRLHHVQSTAVWILVVGWVFGPKRQPVQLSRPLFQICNFFLLSSSRGCIQFSTPPSELSQPRKTWPCLVRVSSMFSLCVVYYLSACYLCVVHLLSICCPSAVHVLCECCARVAHCPYPDIWTGLRRACIPRDTHSGSCLVCSCTCVHTGVSRSPHTRPCLPHTQHPRSPSDTAPKSLSNTAPKITQ